MKIQDALKKPGNKGFTLMEVLIVIVIIAVLAGLAVPIYTATVEKSRRAEALATLGAIRQSEMRYFSQFSSYTDGTSGGTLTTGPLDFTFTAAALGTGGQRVHFTYTIGGIVGSPSVVFVATATRDTNVEGAGAGTVTLNQLGASTGTGNFA